ncbi:MAG: NYN domain-containing protein [Verrucomicrobiota bacterium]
MSLFDRIKALFSGGGPGGSRSKRLYIVDAAPLLSGRNDRLGPRDQISVLQQLSQFAEKEHLRIQAVFEGRPLREVANGETYGAVSVYFAEKVAALQDLLVSLLKHEVRSRQVTVITSNPQVEKRVLEIGGGVMKPATFRRAMENGGGRGEGGGGDRGPSRRRGRRGGRGDRGDRRDRGDRGDRDDRGDRGERPGSAEEAPLPVQEGAPAQAEPQPEPQPERQPESRPQKESNDSVRDLIDLVDE